MKKCATFLFCVLASGSLAKDLSSVVEAELEGQLQAVQTKLEDFLDKQKTRLATVNTKLENQLQAILQKLEKINKQDEIEELEEPQPEAKIPTGFERFGNRYFRIMYQRSTWFTAQESCRQMGGHLASFRNAEEVTAIAAKLWSFQIYWLGLNDQANEGHYVSVASNKSAQFIKWHENEPNDQTHWDNCVVLENGEMYDSNCWNGWYFICQADNQT